MHPLTQRISDVTQRVRRVEILKAAGTVAAAALVVALVLMLADYIMRLSDPGMRWLFSLLLVAAVVAAAYRWLGARAWRSVTPLSIAQRIQTLRPALGSRLASAVEFLSQQTDDPSAGSADLRRSIVAQAAAEVDQLDLTAVIDRRPGRRIIQALAATVVAFVCFGVADPSGLRTAAARLAAPWSDNAWPRRHHLEVSEAPQRVARGQTFEAMLTDAAGVALPEDLRVQYRVRSGGSSQTEEQRLPASAPQVAIVRENVQKSFAYRAVGGDDLTMPWREVKVVDPPRVEQMTVHCQPPEYTGLPGVELRGEDRALAGSLVSATLSVAAVLESAELEVIVDGQTNTQPCKVEAGGGKQTSTVTMPDAWVLELPGDEPTVASYRVRLEAKDGLAGYAPMQTLRIEPDSPPSLEWLSPNSELHLTPQAVLDVRVLVEDNLAIQKAELLWQREETAAVEDDPALQTEAEPTEEEKPENKPPVKQRVAIYTGPEAPPQQESLPGSVPADSREVGHEFDLSLLELKPGDELVLQVQAADFRPGIGRTTLPRRLFILSEEDFDARLAELQSDLAADLKRILVDQRRAREASGELKIEREAGAATDNTTIDRLAALGFEQLRVNEGVTDPARGAVAQAQDLLKEIQANRQQRSELSEQIQRVRDELKNLSKGSLASAARGLADAKRSAQQAVEQSSADSNKQVNESLSKANSEQEQAIEKLEGLVEEMSDWSNYQRFAQELAELEAKQRALREATRNLAVQAATGNKSPAEIRADRAKLRSQQTEINRRFGKLRQSMGKAANKAGENASSSAQALRDALAESQDRATSGKLSDAERQIAMGQLGRSSEQQKAAADDMREMLDTLRDRASNDPGKLAEQLRKAQQKLEQLQDELKGLQQKPDEGDQQRERNKLADKTKRLGRRLNRLTAPQAGQSSQQGAERMQQAAEQPESGRKQMQQAQNDLQRAREQLEQRIRELKNLQALKVLDRLAAKMDGFIQRQNETLRGTIRADEQVLAGEQREGLRRSVQQLADNQQQLRTEVDIARLNVEKREVFDLALRGVVEQMDKAHKLLDAQETGRLTQQREYAALERMKHIADALKITPTPSDQQNQQQNQPGQQGQQGQQQQKPPSPIDVAELKMLRLMQLNVNAETRVLEADAVEERVTTQQAQRQADRLSAEQARLGELVRELIERLSKPPPPPGALPDDAS